ncbi:MAG: ATP synthase subunit alpha [Anaerolineaceae bacterium]|jgi:F-type H+-transporting ATPase subunit alpha|nr:F0F1 ATP synthase subunit alpha [Anaerolineae bacterium]MBL1171238.1 F0F1 ATP synthase subunit alpha [Chloroflexota bacterium]MBV6465368.1 ATP synthase subunit alpha [Anaerolineales bacterium]MCE7905334.1 F0F1 ATP synthase subunit alpha [Anaerolineae bacterium CFX3]MDL1925515.1 F0F1 ATP synthase subunit alpha [Anaerolineae bacterium AMX1]OQY84415.1 MAG: F0F1 ATP synthase subunit alpha [Anaerolineae bacterium UTCFX3]GJQ38477.1 MAG: ATP synthase subunit alpha [Anaerolineaceae bacterium]
MTDLIKQITSDLQKQIEAYQPEIGVSDIGTVSEAGDGIARVSGLTQVRSQELVQFANGVIGIAFNLEKDSVGVIIMGDYAEVTEGMQVRATGRIASVPVGDGLIGRVVNALGEPIDGRGPIPTSGYRPIERVAPGVVYRQDVDTPVQTGIKSIDSMIPVGRGQRELIIGDRQTGKTALAIDTIINQKGKDLVCIYVAIGQKKAAVARTLGILERHGAMEHTIIVVASADEAAALQYIAPYAGCAIGEEFMETGRDALVIYDDLSKHAWAYRQVSLLLRRPPGREAYPGDVFYLHSRLLERAARLANQYVIVGKDFAEAEAGPKDGVDGKVYAGPLSKHEADEACKQMDGCKVVKVKGTGGSLTALPIIETLLGDISAYIPTNVISITDGQIFLEGNLFNAGIRPAVNVGISVSRVGGDAQTKAMKQVAARLRLDMAQFRELAAFAQFGSDLDKATQAQLGRGQRMQEILKQPQYAPMSLENQIIVLFAGTNGYADAVPVEKMRQWETDLARYMETSHPEIGRNIDAEKRITDDNRAALARALETFKISWQG